MPPPAATSQQTGGPAGRTVFGKSMKVVGEISSEEELVVEGELEGKLELRNRLTVGPAGKVNANIKAKEVVVFGTVKGNVESETRVSLRTGASIVGDIKTAGIVIDDGAYFKGGIDITRGEAPASASRPQSSPAGAPAVKATASGAVAGQKR
ncbi:MAG TPA: polymer-forming cytoskeletal protein [Bryobacteraceae bacterium]|nr:polymer-forming cytoskeletal protein [Bryobacteraceae bacterium]